MTDITNITTGNTVLDSLSSSCNLLIITSIGAGYIPLRFIFESSNLANCFISTKPRTDMDDIDPDTMMVAFGVLLSLIAMVELYPAWKNSRERQPEISNTDPDQS
jgi:hypothetical protein